MKDKNHTDPLTTLNVENKRCEPNSDLSKYNYFSSFQAPNRTRNHSNEGVTM